MLVEEGLGYYCIPAFEKYSKWSWSIVSGDACGNCFKTNWEKYQELKKNGAKVKLVVGQMEQGITHAFIIDGDTRYDYAQFREIKEPLGDYLIVNKFVGHSFYDGDNYEEWLMTCKFAGNHIMTNRGQIKVDRTEGTMYNAMKSIINL